MVTGRLLSGSIYFGKMYLRSLEENIILLYYKYYIKILSGYARESLAYTSPKAKRVYDFFVLSKTKIALNFLLSFSIPPSVRCP